MLEILDKDIGGARVRRTFTSGSKQLKAGENLSRDDVLKMNLPNRRALADSGYLELYPRAPQVEGIERIIVGTGTGKDRYNVIEGRVINDVPLSRDDAEKLARKKT
jgi:hypothetical protein